MVKFTDEMYESDPEHCRMIAASLTIAVYKRENSEGYKLLKSTTQGKESCKWIEKGHGGCQEMISLHGHYDGVAEGEQTMNVTKDDLKEFYFIHQDIFAF